MSNLPLFSIITPTFQAGAVLPGLIKSLEAQTFTNWELIISDGGSTDSTLSLIREQPKIRYRSSKDRGIYDAMNLGLEMAKGDWILFMGADDTLFDNHVFESLIPFLTQPGVIYGDVWSERHGGRYDGEFTPEKMIRKNICHQAILFHRSVFAMIGNFNLKYRVIGDREHNMRWFFNPSITKTYVNRIIANYADGGFSSSGLIDQPFFDDLPFLILKHAPDLIPPNEKRGLYRRLAGKIRRESGFIASIPAYFKSLRIRS